MSGRNKKRPQKAKGAPPPSEIPKLRKGDQPAKPLTPSDPDKKLIISFAWVDTDSRWCLSNIEQEHHRALLKCIRDFESMTVNDVVHGHQKCQDYPLDALIDEAFERLVELERDDRDVVHRLQITGKRRLYGFVENNRFYVLWWDPEHEIVPSYKRNT